MHYTDLKQISSAPEQGQILAYTRKQIFFQPYADLEEVKQILEDSEILELHLFDSSQEYRAVASRSPRFENGVIETVVQTEVNNANENYKEIVALEEEFGEMITVLNHVHYDSESGMAHIDNYRLRMGE